MPSTEHVAVALLGGVLAGLLIGWIWSPVVAALAVITVLLRRPVLLGVVGVAVVASSGAVVTAVVARDRPFPNAGWPVRFDWLHQWTLVGVVMIGLSTVLASLADRR